MKKSKALAALAFALAAGAELGSPVDEYRAAKKKKRKKKEKNLKKKVYPNHKVYTFAGVEVTALNEKNAIRKAKKLGLI